VKGGTYSDPESERVGPLGYETRGDIRIPGSHSHPRAGRGAINTP
jgi:hypothetical protein